MPYKCAFGCTTYNPCCDACDGATRSDSSYNSEEEDRILHKAALKGMTREEYLNRKEDD